MAKKNPKDNLKKGKDTQFSGDRAVQCGSKGGKKTAENKAKRKAFKEVFEELLTTPIIFDNVEDTLWKDAIERYGINTDNLTANEAMALAQIVKAVRGDNYSFSLVRDTIGERPADEQKVSFNEIPKITVVRRNG